MKTKLLCMVSTPWQLWEQGSGAESLYGLYVLWLGMFLEERPTQSISYQCRRPGTWTLKLQVALRSGMC